MNVISGAPAVVLEPWATFKVEATWRIARLVRLKDPRTLNSLELLY